MGFHVKSWLISSKYYRWAHQIVSPISNFFNEYFLWFLFQLANWEKTLLWTNEIFFSYCSNWEKIMYKIGETNWWKALMNLFYRWMTLKARDIFYLVSNKDYSFINSFFPMTHAKMFRFVAIMPIKTVAVVKVLMPISYT